MKRETPMPTDIINNINRIEEILMDNSDNPHFKEHERDDIKMLLEDIRHIKSDLDIPLEKIESLLRNLQKCKHHIRKKHKKWRISSNISSPKPIEIDLYKLIDELIESIDEYIRLNLRIRGR